MPAGFARSLEIKIDALAGRRSMAVRGVKTNKKNQMVKELRSLDITYSINPVTRCEVLFGDRRTFICQHQPSNNLQLSFEIE